VPRRQAGQPGTILAPPSLINSRKVDRRVNKDLPAARTLRRGRKQPGGGGPPGDARAASAPAATLFNDANCCAIARAQRVALLVDGAAYFDAFMRAAERAQRSILILSWDFDSRTRLHYDPHSRRPSRLGDFLNELARRRRKLHIRILDWDYPMVFGTEREFSPIYGLAWAPHRRVHVHFDDTHPLAGSHHQKVVVIDDKVAFVGGLDLTCRRWDTPEHLPDDPRRVADHKPYPPFHDLMMMVDGEAAQALGEIARERWLRATKERLRPVTVAGDPWPPEIAPQLSDVRVGLACTSPPSDGRDAVRQVERLYLDMIARAQRYIYIENQYFTSHAIGEALAARLREGRGPEIMLVTRLLSHGWLEEMTMHVLRTRLIRELRAADRHGRFRAYYPHVEGLEAGTCIDMHSKLMIVDDEWLRIGSSNLSNRSMGVDSECDAVIEAEGRAEVRTVIRGFRDALLAEHLGTSPDDVARTIEARGSMAAAIDALGSERRRLKPLEEKLPEWSDTVMDMAAIADMEKPVSLESLIDQFSPDVEAIPRLSWIRLGAAAVAIAALALVWRHTPLAEVFTAENITAWAQDFAGRWWAPLVILFAYTPGSVVMFPRPLITLAAVVAFGPWLGFVYSMGGILIAAVAAYFAGRKMNRDTVRRVAGERLNRLMNILRMRGLLAMTALRLVPLAPFAVESLLAGAIRIRLFDFTVGTFLGMLPGVLAATVFGDQLEAALTDPAQVNYPLLAAVVVLLAGASFFVRRWFLKIERQQISAAHNRRIKAQGA